MINNNNTVDLKLSRGDVGEHLDQQYLISNHPQSTMHADMAAHQENSIFLSICSSDRNHIHKDSGLIISEKFTPNTKDKKSFDIMVNTKERVKVQHLEAPSKLQNNRWNFQSLCSISDSGKEIMPNINNNNIIINQNDSAFKNIRNNIDESKTIADKAENSGVDHLSKVLDYQQCSNYNNSREIVKRTSPVCRTKDQENAFRRIEDVHNYSKLNRYSYSNGSSNSSVHEDDDVDEDEECDDDEDDDEDDELIDDTFETYTFLEKKQQRLSYMKSSDTCVNKSKNNYDNNYKRNINTYNHNINNNDCNDNSRSLSIREQLKDISGVDGMPPVESDDVSNVNFRPDHHARRPMNAFLIFCKRHRAIVKDRYKSFENRAITKILGDWWASLDANEKKCYTNLAQQNKDAFFNANPNFKWYKLPAPPLRTLNTRPSNTERLTDQDDPVQDPIQHHIHHAKDHVFKLADEAQMGDLSTLISNKTFRSQHALQQALGETTQYLSIQIPDLETSANNWAGLDIGNKRRLQNDNSFSSNSSEEDLLSKKNSRSCKGKIYQELVNSGQIAAITKKPKQSKFSTQKTCEQNANSASESSPQPQAEASELFGWGRDSRAQISPNDTLTKFSDKSKSTECSNSQTYDIIQFDLEEKIKELPALNLDIYLQRKRNTKKKKKINSKKRNSSSNSKSPCAETNLTAMMPSPPIDPPKDSSLTNQAVGSRKRKARKESITRRDISLIENEVASLLPLPDNFPSSRYGCYYYDDGQIPATATAATGAQSNSTPALNNASAFVDTPQISSDQFSDVVTNINHNISSTSDLFILAEAAAKRTEISN